MGVEVRVLGTPVVVVDGEVRRVGGDQAAAVLAVLALRSGATVSIDTLVDAAWGEDLPNRVDNALQAVVSRLRRAVGRDLLRSDGRGYRLDVPARAVDAGAFAADVERGISANQRGDAEAAERALEDALAHWRGPLLGGSERRGALVHEAARLEELEASAREELVEAALARGRHAEIIPVLEAMVADAPLRERRWRQLMLALYRSGRQADALRAYQRVRAVLVEELGIEPSRSLAELETAVLSQDPALELSDRRRNGRPTNVTAPERVVGRDDLVKVVLDALRRRRVVVLTGTGGVGKSTVARACATSLPPGLSADGAWLADVGTALHEDEVRRAVAHALPGTSTEPWAKVLDVLATTDALLVLDACEGAARAVAVVVEELQRAAPLVRVLATSRVRLPIDGEVIPISGLSPVDAVELFRARAAGPLTEDDDDTVAGLVGALDHLPLAIELVASRTRYAPVAQLVARSPSVLDLAEDGSGRVGLRRALEDSHRLLSPDAAVAYRRLAVLPATFTLDAAERVIDRPPEEALRAVETLCEHSLVVTDDAGRYRLLDTIRAHAGERLDDAGERSACEERLAAWVEHLVLDEAASPDAPGEEAWLRRLDAERVTVETGLATLAGSEPVRALPVAVAIAQWWDQRGRWRDAAHWLHLLEPASGALGAADRARFCAALARTHERDGDFDAAAVWFRRAVGHARDAADRALLARLLAGLSFVVAATGDAGGGKALAEEAYGEAAVVGDAGVLLVAEHCRGFAAYMADDYDTAATRWASALVSARQVGATHRVCKTLSNLASVTNLQGRPEEGLSMLDEVVTLARDLGDRRALAAAQISRVQALWGLERLDEARRVADETLRDVEELRDDVLLVALLGFVVDIGVGQDDLATARHAAVRRTEVARRRGWVMDQVSGLRDQALVAERYGDSEAAQLLRTHADRIETEAGR